MSTFVADWKDAMYKNLRVMFPTLTKEQIMEELEEDIENHMIDPKSIIHNDYQDDRMIEQPLSVVYQYCNEKKPILAGNGTLFYNQDIATSPIADLIDERIDTRAYYKNQMKETMDKIAALGDITKLTPEGRDKYRQLTIVYNEQDRMQNEAKIRINSIYGSFGTPSFQLYNKYTAAATTGTGQSLISATGIAFEGFLADNIKFKTFGECVVYMTNILEEKYVMPVNNIKIITSVSQVYNRLVSHFERGVFNEEKHKHLLLQYLRDLSPSQLTKIYYKNNLFEFVANPCIYSILNEAFHKIDSFNNPNKVPEAIQGDLDWFWQYCKEYVFYNHHYNERINRLKNDPRKDVKLVDTDSNLIYVQPWVDFLESKLDTETMNLTKDNLDFACVNTIAFAITNMLQLLLKKYCTDAHVLERYHHRINMKNEFCFAKMLFASVKKRYVGKMVLREGKAITKIEIKGHDFKKAGVTEYVSNALTNIIDTRIMNTQKEPADTIGILHDLYEMEKDIVTSLQRGERKYLVRMNCKGEVAYTYPYRMGQVLSVLVWNTVNPDNEIMVPDKLDVVLTNIRNEKDLEPIRTKFPKIYKRLRDNVLNSQLEVFQRKGIQYIAIPNSLDKIPDWIIPFIDYGRITTRTLGTFRPILEALDLPVVGTGDVQYFGNVRQDNHIVSKVLDTKLHHSENGPFVKIKHDSSKTMVDTIVEF